MKLRVSCRWLLWGACALTWACDGAEAPPGSLHVQVASEAALVDRLSRVAFSVTDEAGWAVREGEFPQPARPNQGWGRDLAELDRAGIYTIEVVGFTGAEEELGRARLTGVELRPGARSAAVFHLVAPREPGSAGDAPPVIEAVAACPAVADPGGQISLAVAVRDDDDGEIELTWDANGGELNDRDELAPVWRAASEAGAYQANLIAADEAGGHESAAIRLRVDDDPEPEATLEVVFQATPRLAGAAADPAALAPGWTTDVTVEVYDRDGDELSYAWSDDCGGAFAEADAVSTTWTAPESVPEGTVCELTVAVRDEQGNEQVTRVDVTLTECPLGEPWTDPLAPLPEARTALMASAPVDGVIYLFGGGTSEPSEPFYDTIWAYDIETDSYEPVGEGLPYAMGQLRPYSVAVAENGRIYLSPSLGPEPIADSDGYGSYRCLVELDPATGVARETTACFPDIRWAVRLAASADGRIYTFGGWHDCDEDPESCDIETDPLELCEPLNPECPLLAPGEEPERRDVWVLDTETETLELVLEEIALGGDAIDAIALGSDGVIYLFDHEENRIGAFDPASETFEVLGGHGQVRIHAAWGGDDGLIHGFCTPQGGQRWGGGFVMDPSDFEIEATSYDASILSTGGSIGLSVDPARGRLYAFGGEVPEDGGSTTIDAAVQIRCLP